ncbi:hypothetical protein ECC02_011720 [Trypanosoma cruzi]|uniref:Uncharacterized protein n=1 Tax=Trypanosoma cruzi TaxID=5693 RepID=A0A7J6XMC5_TRYCR|nr:hypothetical protein ECC02_011720 [Trypanosoma cruzi]
MSSTFFHVASTSFTRCSCSVRTTDQRLCEGFPSPPFFFSYSAINSSFLSPLPALLYSRELVATSLSSPDTGPISTMCVLSVSQRWSSPFSFLLSPSEYTGRVTSITFLLSSTPSIVAVMNPLLTAFTSSPCLLPHTRESVPSASVHESPLSSDSYTLRRPSSHAVIIMSFLSSHSTTEGSLQPPSGTSFDSVQLLVSFKVYMSNETAFSSFCASPFFFVPSTGNKRVLSFVSIPDPPPPISRDQDCRCSPTEIRETSPLSFHLILLPPLLSSALTSPFTSNNPQSSAPPSS